MFFVLLALAAIGHPILWAAAVNRVHGIGAERRWIDALTLLCAVMLGVLPLALAALFWQHGLDPATLRGTPLRSAANSYVVFCALLCVASVIHRAWLTFHAERQGAVVANHTTRMNWNIPQASLLAPGLPAWLGKVPGNEVVSLQVHEKRLVLPRLTPGCGGVRIAHISDLHMSGRIHKEYFERVAEEVNLLKPDLIALTGDLVECDACLDWLPDTLGRLRAPGGVYFVLGNHDRRTNHRRLVESLEGLGLIHLGGRCQHVTYRDMRIELAGNELPWFGPAPRVSPLQQASAERPSLRILLAHAPDLFAWASDHNFDLILAGHNHGGQVCLPLLGAILAPSCSGTRYAGGTFRRGNTLMHVSRGTASLTPFRWNCPPEIALLDLRPAS